MVFNATFNNEYRWNTTHWMFINNQSINVLLVIPVKSFEKYQYCNENTHHYICTRILDKNSSTTSSLVTQQQKILEKLAVPVLFKQFWQYNLYQYCWLVWFMVFNANFNNISVISWWSVLLVEETGVPGDKQRLVENTGITSITHTILVYIFILVLFTILPVSVSLLLKRNFKQWWSSVPPISTKRTIASHLDWTHWTQKKPTTYDFENPGPGMGQVQKGVRVKPVYGIQTFPSWYL